MIYALAFALAITWVALAVLVKALASLSRKVTTNHEEFIQTELHRLTAFNNLTERVNAMRVAPVVTQQKHSPEKPKRPRTMTDLRAMTEEWAAKEEAR